MGRVIGRVTLNRRLPELKPAALLVVDPFDAAALQGHASDAPRGKAAPQSLVVFDELGANQGQIICISEGAEATMPFGKLNVPIDAYATAILDTLDIS